MLRVTIPRAGPLVGLYLSLPGAERVLLGFRECGTVVMKILPTPSLSLRNRSYADERNNANTR